MGQMCDTLIPQEKIRKEDLQLLRVAALLHDVGHYPFSHAIERNLSSRDAKLKHSNIGIEILKKSEIGEILSKEGLDPDNVEKVLKRKMNPEYPVYSYLIDSDLDVDKIDYLLRDSVHTGVAYGSIDSERLVRTITVDNEGNLAIREKGKQAVENLMIARYHMYQTVYFQKSVAAFELMLTRIYKELLKEGLVFNEKEIVKLVYENKSLGFCNFDEAYVFTAMRNYNGNNTFLKELINMILCRRPLKKIFDEAAFIEGEGRKTVSTLALLSKPVQIATCAEKAGIPEDWIFLYTEPLIMFSESPIKIEQKGNFVSMVEDETSIAYLLARHSYTNYRVYTKKGFEEPLVKAITECLL